MFNQKTKSEDQKEAPQTGTTLIASGTVIKGDLSSNGDIRIDGELEGNIQCTAKVVIGSNGVVNGDIIGQQADIMGTVKGTVKLKDLLQLKAGGSLTGNIEAGKLQIDPSAHFNGQCQMKEASPAASLNGAASKKEKQAITEAAYS